MSGLASPDATDLREWGSPGSTRFRPFEWLWLFIVLGVPAIILVLVVLLLAGVAAAGAFLVLYALVVAWWLARPGRKALAAQADAQPAGEDEAPRLMNLVRGIARDLKLPPPKVWLASGPPNALICRAGGPVLLVRRGLLEEYTRTELEAVIAHCLIRIATGELRRASLSAALGAVAGPAGVSNAEDVDTRTVALTRYPPALASAIEKAAPAGDAGRSFWFVAAGSTPHAPERARRLRDL